LAQLTAEDLVKLIRQRYPVNRADGFHRYVVLEQVADGTGMHHGHWVDVAVFDMWPSTGLMRSAFEIKVSRSDFLRELQHPTKYKWVQESFHEFWYVAPQDAIKREELPANAGWLCPRADKLIVKRHAVRNEHAKLDDVLLAAFMRAAAKEIWRIEGTVAKEILDNSSEYHLAKLFQEAVKQFLANRGALRFMDRAASVDQVVEWLEEATMEKQLQQDRDHLLQFAGHFQRNIMSLLNLFLVIANKSLLARDELGNYIVKAYGGDDPENVEALKKFARRAKAFDTEKQYVQLVELVMNWDKEFNPKMAGKGD
jgi:hypothetical protein